MEPFLRSVEPDANLVVDGGEIAAWVDVAARGTTASRDWCSYLGYLGTTPGLAIGTQPDEPERPVVLLFGDGGMGFHIQEFDTMVRHGLNMVRHGLNITTVS